MPSNISYLDEVWNPVEGCSPISEGCAHCWALAMANRFHGGAHPPVCHWERVGRPRTWRKPRRIGVCFTSDLCHEGVPPAMRQQMLDVMMEVRRHTYLVLTKRAGGLEHWNFGLQPLKMAPVSGANDFYIPNEDAVTRADHIWVGVTAENQRRFDERVPQLVHTDCCNRWLSLEPLLGQIFLTNSFRRWPDKLHWVVVGCESGQHARECPIEWAEALVHQCQQAGVPVYVKQVRVGKKVLHKLEEFPESVRVQQYPKGWQ